MIDRTDKTNSLFEPLDDASGRRDEDLRCLDISSQQHTTYEWNGYHYSNASDAIAAAKRASR